MNFSNLTIENLFSDNKGNKPSFCGNIDIKTLFPNENKNYEFDSRTLLDNIYEKREKLQKFYSSIYKKCCETIKSANKSGFTKITYEIPKYSDCIGYDYDECINFIKAKLCEQKIDVYQIKKSTILISWDDLEKKINK